MRTQTKADVMKQAHALKAELFAPTFAEALAIAYQYHRRLFNAIDQRGFRV